MTMKIIIALAIISSIIPFVISSPWVKRICRITLLVVAILGTNNLLLSHRLTAVSVFQGKQKHEIENYTEAEKNALGRGIFLHMKESNRSLPLLIIPVIGLFALSGIKQKNPNQNIEPIVTTPTDKVEAQSTQAHV